MKKVLPTALFAAVTLLITAAVPSAAAPAAAPAVSAVQPSIEPTPDEPTPESPTPETPSTDAPTPDAPKPDAPTPEDKESAESNGKPANESSEATAADSLVVYAVYGEPAVYSNSDIRGGIGVRGSFVVTGAPEGTVEYQYAVVPYSATEFPEEYETVDAEEYTVIAIAPEFAGWQRLLVRPVYADGTVGGHTASAYEVAGPGESPTSPAPAARVERLPIDLTQADDETAQLRVWMTNELFSGTQPGVAPRGEVVVRRGDIELGRAGIPENPVAVEIPEDSLGDGNAAVAIDYYPYPGADPISVTGESCLHECTFDRAWTTIYGQPTMEARVASTPKYTSLTGFQWFRDGQRVAGETGKYFMSGPPDRGHTFKARVTVNHPRMVPVTVTSAGFVPTKVPSVGIRYFVKETNVSWSDGDGDMWQVENGEVSGTTNPAARNESVTVQSLGDYHLVESYSAHVPGRGWIKDEWYPQLEGEHGAQMAGTFQRDLDFDAYRVSVLPKVRDWYDVYYRSYVAPFGWLGWAKNSQPSGTTGYGFDVSAVQMVVREKGEAAPTPSHGLRPAYLDKAHQDQIWSNAYVRDVGWSGGKPGGYTAGSTNGALEGLRFSAVPTQGEGGVSYRALVHGKGWSAWTDSGTAGAPNANLVEAYQLQLTGSMAEQYDVYARSYVGGWGWLGWAKNGLSSGSSGYDRALRATQVVLVPKGQPAPTGSGLPRTYVR